MICPFCKYDYRKVYEKDKVVKIIGEKGDFYESPIKMEMYDPLFGDSHRAVVYGCPSCKAVFVDA